MTAQTKFNFGPSGHGVKKWWASPPHRMVYEMLHLEPAGMTTLALVMGLRERGITYLKSPSTLTSEINKAELRAGNPEPIESIDKGHNENGKRITVFRIRTVNRDT